MTDRQKEILIYVCGKLEGMSIGLAYADVPSGLADILKECRACIEQVLKEPGESVEELLKGVK